jgi:hypothetical protein
VISLAPRVGLPRSKLEAMLLEFLQAYPDCREATQVVIRRLDGMLVNGANWALVSYDSGRAQREHCDPAIYVLVPIVQHHFDMAPDA